MKIRKIFYVLLRNIFIFIAVTATLSGVITREGVFGYIVLGILWALAMLCVPAVLSFFKLPVNFAGQLLIGTLLSIVVFIGYRYVVIGFVDFTSMTVGGSALSFITLPTLKLDEMGTVLYTAILTSTLSVIMEELSSKK
jgi:hypothetical protein